MSVRTPPVLRGAISGWYRLIPSGNIHTASPPSRAYRGSAMININKTPTNLHKLEHDLRIVSGAVSVVFPSLDRYRPSRFDEPT